MPIIAQLIRAQPSSEQSSDRLDARSFPLTSSSHKPQASSNRLCELKIYHYREAIQEHPNGSRDSRLASFSSATNAIGVDPDISRLEANLVALCELQGCWHLGEWNSSPLDLPSEDHEARKWSNKNDQTGGEELHHRLCQAAISSGALPMHRLVSR